MNLWCLNNPNPDTDIDIDDTIEDDQEVWVLSSVYFPLADINTPQLFFKIYKIQLSCKYRWMQRYNFKFRQHIAGIHYPIHKTKDETHLCYLMWAQRQKIHYFHAVKRRCGDAQSGDVEMHQMRCGELEMHKEQAVSTSYRTHRLCSLLHWFCIFYAHVFLIGKIFINILKYFFIFNYES